jgi:hypothetical protein
VRVLILGVAPVGYVDVIRGLELVQNGFAARFVPRKRKLWRIAHLHSVHADLEVEGALGVRVLSNMARSSRR